MRQPPPHKHVQGFIQLKKDTPKSTGLKLLPDGAHIEKALRGRYANFKYCTKEGNVIANKGFDKETEQEKTRKEKQAAQILNDIKELTEAQFVMKHPDFYLSHYETYKKHKLNYDTRTLKLYEGELKEKNFWIFGAPGIGKSKYTNELIENTYQFRKPVNKWFDSYDRHKAVIIIEDFPKDGGYLVQHIKILADRYPFIGEIKGGAIGISPDDFCLIITSNFKPEEVFTDEEDCKAIKRRFSVIDFNTHADFGSTPPPPKHLQVLKDIIAIEDDDDLGVSVSAVPLKRPPQEDPSQALLNKPKDKKKEKSPGYYDQLRIERQIKKQQKEFDVRLEALQMEIVTGFRRFESLLKNQNMRELQSFTPSDAEDQLYDEAFDYKEEDSINE